MEHYVIFFCDDCDRLEPAITAFKKVHPAIRVNTSSDVDDLIDKIRRQSPELVLLYFHDPAKSYVEVLKQIRLSVEGRSIPILIYHELPDAATLEKAFSDFRRSQP